MPWLTVHIALPMILLSGWSFGYLIETTNWSRMRDRRGVLVVILLIVFVLSLAGFMGSILGANPPFQGKELSQLQATSTFFFSLLVTIASGAGLFYLLKNWSFSQIVRLSGLIVLGILAFLTARTAYTASFINYDLANEYLVYAHAGQGPKQIMDQVSEISRRTTNGEALVVAYDHKSTYPFWWYLRNYPNTNYFAANPTRDLRDSPVIIVGSENYGKIEPIVGQAFDSYEYTRMWWPNQDYYNLTWERIWNAISNPAMRSALFQVWLNRDFTEYGQVVGRDTTAIRTVMAALVDNRNLVAQAALFHPLPEANLGLEIDPAGIKGGDPGVVNRVELREVFVAGSAGNHHGAEDHAGQVLVDTFDPRHYAPPFSMG